VNRAYVIVNVQQGTTEQVAITLSNRDGVIMVDILEDKPDIIMVVQAKNRQKLAELTIQAVTSVERFTEGLQLMPARSNINHEAAAMILTSKNN
jgi:hypothetical protein